MEPSICIIFKQETRDGMIEALREVLWPVVPRVGELVDSCEVLAVNHTLEERDGAAVVVVVVGKRVSDQYGSL